MIYYVLGFIVSVVVFSIFYGLLRTPINNPYDWMIVFSLDFLSGASIVIFGIGLFFRAVQEFRLRNPVENDIQTQQMTLRLPQTSPPRPSRQTEFGKRGGQRPAATYEEIQQASRQTQEQVAFRLKEQAEDRENRSLKGFENINRH